MEQKPKLRSEESVHEISQKENLEAFPGVLASISQNVNEIEQLIKQQIPFNPEDPLASGNMGRKIIEARDQLSDVVVNLKKYWSKKEDR